MAIFTSKSRNVATKFQKLHSSIPQNFYKIASESTRACLLLPLNPNLEDPGKNALKSSSLINIECQGADIPHTNIITNLGSGRI